MGLCVSDVKQAINSHLVELIEDHYDRINFMAVSDDESVIATASEDKTIRMYSTMVEPTECLGVLKGHKGQVSALTIHDVYVVSGSEDHTIRKWEMTSCACLSVYRGHTGDINRLIANGVFILSSSNDRTVKLWDFLADGKHETAKNIEVSAAKSFEVEKHEPAKSVEVSAAKSFEGHTRAVFPIIYLGSSTALDSTTLDLVDVLKSHQTIITGSADCTARSWSISDAVTMKVFKGHTAPISCMSTDPAGKILYTGSLDNTIRSWNIGSGKCLKTMEGHTGGIICFAVVGRFLYSGDQDGMARSWVHEHGDCAPGVFKGHNHSIIAIAYKDGFLFTACGDTTVRIHEVKTGKLHRVLEGHEGAVSGMAIVGDHIYTSSYDSSIRKWTLKGLKESNPTD